MAREVAPHSHGPRTECTPGGPGTTNRASSCPQGVELSTGGTKPLVAPGPRRNPGPMTPTMRTLLVLALTAVVTLPAASPARASRPPRFAWPLAPPHQVVRTFDPPATEYAAGHRGVDLAAPAGTPVLAAADGVVLHAGPVAERTVVSLLHAGGLRTTYEPVTPTVRRGQHVGRGSPIGTLAPGHEGCPAAACLHWGAVRITPPRSRTYLDPLRLLANGRVRLLPRSDTTDRSATSRPSPLAPACDGRPSPPAPDQQRPDPASRHRPAATRPSQPPPDPAGRHLARGGHPIHWPLACDGPTHPLAPDLR